MGGNKNSSASGEFFPVVDTEKAEGYGAIFRSRFRDLYFYGLKLVSHSELVKDTIQDIFADLLTREESLGKIENIHAYLFLALRRELLRRIKKIRQADFSEFNVPEPFVFSSEDFLIQKEQGAESDQMLMSSLKGLTDRQREVILLRFKYELDFEVIASVMKMKVQSVRNLLFRALEQIRKNFKDHSISDIGDVDILLTTIFFKNRNFYSKY